MGARSTVKFRRVRQRVWLLRLMSVGTALLIVLVFECLCRFAGWGKPRFDDDPFVGFSSVRPLFVKTADGGEWHTAPARRRFFREDSFSVRKAPGEFRIFVFGGSTVQGNPFSIETSFPTYLRIALEQAAPNQVWDVVNCGGVSYASYRLAPIMVECLAYEPDLFIFCEGHNEFLEDVSYQRLRTAVPWLQKPVGWLEQWQSFHLLKYALTPVVSIFQAEHSPQKPLLAVDVDTLLDHDGGLAEYRRDDVHAAAVATHFESSLQRMSALCRAARVPLLFIKPPANLADCPPFKSEFSADTSPFMQGEIRDLLADAGAHAAKDLEESEILAQRAVDSDPRFAIAWYQLGQIQMSAQKNELARRSLTRARDEDICPLRITSDLEGCLLRVAEQTRTPLIDAHELLRSRCGNGIVGENVLVDHVHPSFRGHEDIAVAITEWMSSAGLVTLRNPDWREHMRAECRRQLQALDNLYFLRGQRALENLKLWAAGRSGGPPLPKPARR